MKRKGLIFVLALTIIFGSVSIASAYTSAANINTNRTSNTSANVRADITYNTTVDTCTIKMTLQEKYNGSWRTATGVSTKTVSKTKKKVTGLTLAYKFQLAKGKVYRVKTQFISKKGSSGITTTRYTGSF